MSEKIVVETSSLPELPEGTKFQIIPPIFHLNNHDLQVVLFHMLIAIVQTWLIGANVEYPAYAPFFQVVAEFLRRLVV